MKLLDFEFNEKNVIRCLIAIGIIIVLIIFFSVIEAIIPKRFKKDVEVVSSENYVVEVDYLDNSGIKLVVSGQAYNGPEAIQRYHQYYVLKNNENNKSYILKTKMEQREHLKNTGAEFSGMHSQALTMFMPKGTYDLYVYYDTNSENILLKTDKQVEI